MVENSSLVKWSAIQATAWIANLFFFNVGPPKEDIFLTAFYDLTYQSTTLPPSHNGGIWAN